MAVVAVIGGSGRMGAWFANFLSKNRYEVIISDKKTSSARAFAKKKRFRYVENPFRAAQFSQIVLLATPTAVTKTLLGTVTSHALRTKLIVEISSVKQPLAKTIQSLARSEYQIMSIHPMFGAGTRSLAGKSIIVAHMPHNSAPARRILSVLAKNGARIIHSSLKGHDQLMATTLALPHLMNFAYIETLREAGIPLDKVRELGGTTLKLQLLIAEALYDENPDNEASILADNKHNAKAFGTFLQQINKVRGIIQRRTRVEWLRQLRADAAYAQKDKLFRTAHERFVAAVDASSSSG